MNIPTAFKPLILGLANATANRRATWTEGPARDAYSTSLSSFTINIVGKPPNAVTPFEEGYPLFFKAIDSDGKLIDEFTVQYNDGSDYKMLFALFDHARRSARQIDEKVNQMLRELKAPE